MTTPAPPPMSRLRLLALVLAAGAFLLPFAVGRLVELALKAINPDGVDITHGLAYLTQLLVVGAVLVIASLAIAVVVIVRLQRAEGRDAARAPWTVLVTQTALVVGVLLLSVMIDAVESASVG